MILTGDCRKILPTLEAESIDCCVTSPPYWGLRNYGMDDQIGVEETLDQYIQTLVGVFREVRRVLKPEGTLWLNLGDKYAKSTPCGNGDPTIGKKPIGSCIPMPKEMPYQDKCLMLVPARVSIALIDDGWILRNEIIWAKTNPIPSSAPDRCNNSHESIYLFGKSDHKKYLQTSSEETIFLFAKQPKYYFDQDSIAEPASTNDQRQPVGSKGTVGHPNAGLRNKIGGNKFPGKVSTTYSGNPFIPSGTRIKRDVWTLSTATSENQREEIEHYAKYPEALVKPCILAGCPVGGTVLDPFSGSGTTGKVAHDLGREYIGIELNPAYAEASEKKIGVHLQTRLSAGISE
ncbi:MAG: site-specific DNA-methyltransferase [Bacilli bacterium]|nr:site-specific DNA-methyltransferase [Bacilli bacterium]